MFISLPLLLLLFFLLIRRRLLLYNFPFCIAIVMGREANSGKSRNGLITGLHYNTASTTPSSGSETLSTIQLGLSPYQQALSPSQLATSPHQLTFWAAAP